MRSSNIGGQAVMEGVMMKNKDRYAVAVRKPDNEIEIDIKSCASSAAMTKIKKIPFIRGIFNFVDSLVIGMKALSYSADFFEEDEEESKKDGKTDSKVKSKDGSECKSKELSEDSRENKTEDGTENVKDKKNVKDEKNVKDKKNLSENLILGGTIAFSVVLALALFCGLPFLAAELIKKYITDNYFIVATIEGIIRIIIFVAYVALISLMEDIKRVFMYHGAEHKCINCIEHGLELNVENVRKSSKQHKRCGTSFLLIVMVISIVFLMFINVENRMLGIALRLIIIPVIAGVSYEFIRLAGNSDNKLVNILSKPGLWLQNLTTKEPTDDMIEVGIASVEAIFDWKEYLHENFPDAEISTNAE